MTILYVSFEVGEYWENLPPLMSLCIGNVPFDVSGRFSLYKAHSFALHLQWEGVCDVYAVYAHTHTCVLHVCVLVIGVFLCVQMYCV